MSLYLNTTGQEYVTPSSNPPASTGTFTYAIWIERKDANASVAHYLLLWLDSTKWIDIDRDSSNRIKVAVTQASSNLSYLSTDTVAIGDKVFIAITYDDSASPRCHIYIGDVATPAAEVAYTTNTDGSGAISAPSAGTFFLLGRDINGRGFGGYASYLWWFSEALTQGQLQALQMGLAIPVQPELFYIPGFYGTSSVPDLSGNGLTGTVTGTASVQDHIAVRPPFARRVFGVAETLAAPTATYSWYTCRICLTRYRWSSLDPRPHDDLYVCPACRRQLDSFELQRGYQQKWLGRSRRSPVAGAKSTTSWTEPDDPPR